MGSNRYFVVFAALCFSLMPGISTSGSNSTLKEIMQGLRDDFVRIGDGLLHDDFEQIADGARGIAEHPKIPPEQAKRIAAALGAEMPGFKAMDKRVHDLSLRIMSAAKSSDTETALQSYLAMTEGCLACHTLYKDRVAAILTKSDGVPLEKPAR